MAWKHTLLLLVAVAACTPGPLGLEPIVPPPGGEIDRTVEPELTPEAGPRWAARRSHVLEQLAGNDSITSMAILGRLAEGKEVVEHGVATLREETEQTYLNVTADLDTKSTYRMYLMEDVRPCTSLGGHPLFPPPEELSVEPLGTIEPKPAEGRLEIDLPLDVDPIAMAGHPLLLVGDEDDVILCGVFQTFTAVP